MPAAAVEPELDALRVAAAEGVVVVEAVVVDLIVVAVVVVVVPVDAAGDLVGAAARA